MSGLIFGDPSDIEGTLVGRTEIALIWTELMDRLIKAPEARRGDIIDQIKILLDASGGVRSAGMCVDLVYGWFPKKHDKPPVGSTLNRDRIQRMDVIDLTLETTSPCRLSTEHTTTPHTPPTSEEDNTSDPFTTTDKRNAADALMLPENPSGIPTPTQANINF